MSRYTCVTQRSLNVPTAVTNEEVLLFRFGSGTLLDTVAVLVYCPDCALLTITVMVAVAPLARLAMVSLIWLPLLVSVNAGPLFWFCDTKLTPAGSVMVNVPVAAAPGLSATEKPKLSLLLVPSSV